MPSLYAAEAQYPKDTQIGGFALETATHPARLQRSLKSRSRSTCSNWASILARRPCLNLSADPS